MGRCALWMTGRSIPRAAMRTRVTARSAGIGATDGGAPDPSGGSVMSGLGVGGTTASRVGPGVWTGSAVTGFV